MSAPELIPVPAVWSGDRRGGSRNIGEAEVGRRAARHRGWNFIKDFHTERKPFGIVMNGVRSRIVESGRFSQPGEGLPGAIRLISRYGARF